MLKGLSPKKPEVGADHVPHDFCKLAVESWHFPQTPKEAYDVDGCVDDLSHAQSPVEHKGVTLDEPLKLKTPV
jgi:hypothetical protein